VFPRAHGLPDHVRPAAELAQPERVADEHDAGGVRRVLVTGERAADRRPRVDDVEVAARHRLAAHPLRAAGSRDRRARPGRHLDGVERPGPRGDVPDVEVRDVCPLSRRAVEGPDPDEAVRVPERRALEQHRVGHGEYEHRAADAEGDAADRRKREPERAAEAPQGVAQIAKQGVHRMLLGA